jgi:phage/plasmid-associated DNA primase
VFINLFSACAGKYGMASKTISFFDTLPDNQRGSRYRKKGAAIARSPFRELF